MKWNYTNSKWSSLDNQQKGVSIIFGHTMYIFLQPRTDIRVSLDKFWWILQWFDLRWVIDSFVTQLAE